MVIQKYFVQSHEHHMAPIIGIAHVAYIPKDRVVGLVNSRVARYFQKTSYQERLTMQIATTLMESLDAKGVAGKYRFNSSVYDKRGIKRKATKLLIII